MTLIEKIVQWDMADGRAKASYVHNKIKPLIGNARIPNWFRALYQTIIYEIDDKGGPEKSSDWIDFIENNIQNLVKITNIPPENINTLYKLYQTKNVDLQQAYTTNRQILCLNEKDFLYTMNILDACTRPSKISRYFDSKENAKLCLQSIFNDGKILPTGLNDKTNKNTIWATVNKYSSKSQKDEDGNIKVDSETKRELGKLIQNKDVQEKCYIDKNEAAYLKNLIRRL